MRSLFWPVIVAAILAGGGYWYSQFYLEPEVAAVAATCGTAAESSPRSIPGLQARSPDRRVHIVDGRITVPAA